MAVYTAVPAEALADFLADYDCGTLISAKGIAEGVSNSNFLVETTGSDGLGHRYILTLYEHRTDPEDLPFFIDLLDHLGAKGLPVPRFIPDSVGHHVKTLCGRPACLIEFLTGVSVTEPTAGQAFAAGRAMAELHRAAADFVGARHNDLGIDGWQPLAASCDGDLDSIAPGLEARVTDELAHLTAAWPDRLARSVIHADLFPDNVLMLGERVTGLIDFYFSCTDIRAYDLAVIHGAWCFDGDGATYHADRGEALVAGYQSLLPLSAEERAAFSTLCRGAAIRFLLTRAYDWINTPADAMVTRKDPLAYLRRLDFYAAASADSLLGASVEARP
ncbi:homoserine kinase [Sphingobium sufflavum]|uniref:homoserine kinase n=1 Tax=Sphingobium sufflavum TaxID=1129547 RepID=UPI001F1BD262|nr:homoserine kinase [Sphingobium sufflavum]MCE7795854.1 homoserine kinase [Sphingobium sufflavum]